MKGSDPAACSEAETRRRFLRRAGVCGVATTLAGLAAPRCHAGESSLIRLALVGCGGRGTGAVADAFAARGGPVKLYAMADLFEDRLQGSLNRLNQVHADKVDVPPERRFVGFDAYRKAIDCLGPTDVVLLTTHAAFRPLHFEYAVSRGVNVFAEKSFATDAPAVRRWLKMAELSEKKGLKVGVGFMWRHSKARQETIKRIHDGMIGQVHTLRIYRVHGPVHCPRRPPEANELVFQLRHPNSFTWVSSGFFVDWHCHNVDVACWAKGAWPVAAQGMGGRCYAEAGNQFDHYTVEYTFADGAKLFAFSRHMRGCWQTYSDYAHGSKGSAVIMDSLGDPRPRIYKSQNMVPEEMVWEFGRQDPNPYRLEWQLLLDAIRQDKPHNEARRAGEADLAALMGRMATHSGQYITWDEAMESDFQFVQDIDSMNFDTPAPIHEGPDGIYPCPQPGITKEH
ncbi:MAG TPA: Gfo/Idh/MocA family oxidoreductase [Planctomycetaceae bacterium]|nr:Gfo/Idh/MocA family oxidoreductase [Planctomycetaceae bacterium]HIQ19660.1 Gfo/Idh/MocA family oxidoreductase [Planctomycetota bacterium]